MSDITSGQAELLRIVGRVEKAVDAIDTKLDTHAEKITRHDVQIDNLTRLQQRGWERFVLWLTVIMAFVAALLGDLLTLFHR